MASERTKSMGLALGIGLSAVGGGLAAWLTNLQLGNVLGTDAPVDLPEYMPPPESPLADEPVIIPEAVPGEDRPSAGASASASASHPPLSEFSSIEFRNIFNSEAAGRSDAVVEDTGEREVVDDGPVETRLGPLCVYVHHTLDAQPQRYAWALISKDERGTDQEIFSVGDEVFEEGSSLARVGLHEIEIRRRDDSVEKFIVGEACKSAAAAPVSRPVAAAEPDAEGGNKLGDGIEQVGENQFVIPASEIEAAMSNLETLAKDARVVPHYQNGQVVGFKVFRIKAGSVYSKLGLKNGDIIERVNGQDIDGPERALALYQTLRNEKGFQLDLRRRNQPLTLSYEVK